MVLKFKSVAGLGNSTDNEQASFPAVIRPGLVPRSTDLDSGSVFAVFVTSSTLSCRCCSDLWMCRPSTASTQLRTFLKLHWVCGSVVK